jgi:hypothetical protein
MPIGHLQVEQIVGKSFEVAEHTPCLAPPLHAMRGVARPCISRPNELSYHSFENGYLVYDSSLLRSRTVLLKNAARALPVGRAARTWLLNVPRLRCHLCIRRKRAKQSRYDFSNLMGCAGPRLSRCVVQITTHLRVAVGERLRDVRQGYIQRIAVEWSDYLLRLVVRSRRGG